MTPNAHTWNKAAAKQLGLNQPNALRMVTIEGTNYFVDERLEEIREVERPHINIPFEDLTDEELRVINK